MTRPFPVVYLLSLLLLSACSSPEDRAARADEEVSQQRLQLIEQHQTCVEEAAGDAQNVEARSEARRVGKASVRTRRSRWSTDHLSKNNTHRHTHNLTIITYQTLI